MPTSWIWLLAGSFAFQPATKAPAKSAAENHIVCALGTRTASWKPASDESPSADAMQLAVRINAALKTLCGTHCPLIALFRNTTAEGIMLVFENGDAKLLYAPPFLSSVYNSYGDAGVIALFAHELGHGLDDNLGAAWVKSNWTPELRADSWAGCALARTRLSSKDTKAALDALAKYPAAPHPAWDVRSPAVRAGYAACGGDIAAFKPAVAR
jgi:hypothetical protein